MSSFSLKITRPLHVQHLVLLEHCPHGRPGRHLFGGVVGEGGGGGGWVKATSNRSFSQLNLVLAPTPDMSRAYVGQGGQPQAPVSSQNSAWPVRSQGCRCRHTKHPACVGRWIFRSKITKKQAQDHKYDRSHPIASQATHRDALQWKPQVGHPLPVSKGHDGG